MNTKKITAALLAAVMTLGLTACGGSQTGTESAAASAAAAVNSTADSANNADSAADSSVDQAALEQQINDLLSQESDIFATHQDLWEKVFASMNKDDADPSADYCVTLKNAVDAIKDELSDEDYTTLTDDIELIRPIEAQATELYAQYTPDNSGTQSISVDSFPAFTGKDLDGNDVDNSLFSQNAVTVVNFWFNACKPCVEELSTLNQLNEDLKAKGGAVVGINSDALSGDADTINEVKSILETKGASYQNIYFDWDSDAGKMVANIFSFPTTIVVDRNGNIIGDPIVGGLDNDAQMAEVNSRIEQILAADQGT